MQSSASVESTKAPTFVSLEQLGEWLSTGLDDSIPVRMVVQPETEQVLFVVQPNTSQSGQEFPVQKFYLAQLASSEDSKIVNGVLQGSQELASGEKTTVVSIVV